MSVEVVVGDLFESDAQTLTNAVNTVGVMGKGIALGFRRKFPDMYNDYVSRCRNGKVKLGEPYPFRLSGDYKPDMSQPTLDGMDEFTPVEETPPRLILNFPTKAHWRSRSRRDAIDAGLEHLAQNYREWGIKSLAVPALGCGEGGLRWSDVFPILYQGLATLQIPVTLYAPLGTPSHELRPLSLTAHDDRRSCEQIEQLSLPLYST